jgi:hypothetical protein
MYYFKSIFRRVLFLNLIHFTFFVFLRSLLSSEFQVEKGEMIFFLAKKKRQSITGIRKQVFINCRF